MIQEEINKYVASRVESRLVLQMTEHRMECCCILPPDQPWLDHHYDEDHGGQDDQDGRDDHDDQDNSEDQKKSHDMVYLDFLGSEEN